MAHAGLAAVVGKVADADAPVLLDIAGALAADALLLAAGADAYADLALVLLEPVGKMLDGQGLAVGGDGLLHGDDVHADAAAAGRHHLRDARQGQIGHALKKVRYLRRDRRDLRTHDHNLGAAGNEHIQHPALFVVGILAVQILKVPLDQAGLAQGLQRDLQTGIVITAELFQLLKGLGLALAHQQGNVQAVVRHGLAVAPLGILQSAVDAPVLRRFGRHLLQTEEDLLAVGDDLPQLKDLLVSRHFFCHKQLSFFIAFCAGMLSTYDSCIQFNLPLI